jgi:hypothetical protein
MNSTKRERGTYIGFVPPSPKLVFSLVVGMEDESFDVMLGIPKVKGLEAKGME